MKDNGYGNVAEFYDEVLGNSDENVKFVRKKILKYNRNAHSVFEMGCGTGNNLLYLSEFYETSGVDINSHMLKIAERKINRKRIFKGDIRNFIPSASYDAVFCIYDTVNHLLLFNEWKRFFRNVSQSLNTDGIFIFDFNTLFKLEMISEISPLINKFGKNYLIADVKKISANTFNWNMKVFRNKKNDEFALHETNIKESSFDLFKILTALEKDFEILETADESGKTIFSQSERIFMICRKLNKNI
ncbi:MAG: class I SAM-dependent methyltransferase [Bacteroidetes bacterium]|nr:class I SAM-dependent methyltransferase [Bacteroidota bacterium]